MAGSRERVLITGGSGFIGANLARAEIAAGNDVHLLLRPESNGWRLHGLNGQFIRHEGDLRDAAAVRRAVAGCKPDIVYHLATHGAYPFQKDRGTILATNLLGTANLLDALVGQDCRGFVHTGSSSEYGHKNAPMREDDVLEPRTDYGVTKAAATLLCQAEAFRGAPVATVRVFSAYGPWEEPSRLVPYVMDCAMRKVRPKVTAGRQPRDFIYVDDVVELLRLAARDPQCQGRILHAGTGVERSVRQMIDAIVDVCAGPAPEFGAESIRQDEPAHWVASTETTFLTCGWKARYDLRSGIARMKQWWLQSQAADQAA
jgi:nucleoside-diphosphate-sugar epimerase